MLRATAATFQCKELRESSSARSSGVLRSIHGQVNAQLPSQPPPPPLAPAPQQQRQQTSFTRIGATSCPVTARGVASDAAAQKTASGAGEERAPPTKEWHLVPLGYRPAHAVALQERIEEMWESRVGREAREGEEGRVEGMERRGEGAEESGKEEERRELEALNWAFSQLPVSVFPCQHKVLEVPSNARLSDALRLLQHAGLTAAPVRDAGVGDDAPLQQRYLGMVDGAGIVLWVMGQLNQSSIEVRMAAAAGGGLAGMAFGGLGAAALGAPGVATLAAMWAGSMAGGLLGATSAEAPGELEAGGGVERLRVSAGGLDRLLQGNLFQTAKVSVTFGGWGGGSEGEVGNGGARVRGRGSEGVCRKVGSSAAETAKKHPLSSSALTYLEGSFRWRSFLPHSSDSVLSLMLLPSPSVPSNPSPPSKVSDLVGSFRWRSFLPLSSSDSVLSLMLLLAMPHRPQVLPIVTYPSTSSSPFSSPSSASPASSSSFSSSPEPAAAASSAGSGSTPVPSLSALVSQADVVNFLAECDGQPWFEWVAGRSLQDMGLPRMGAGSTVKVEESDPVMEPFRLMLQHDIGGVPVVVPGTNRITANVSARDVLQLLTSPHLAEQHHLKPLTVADLVHDAQRPQHGAADVIWPIMVPPVTCHPSTPLREVIHAFRVARVHRIYVTREPDEGEGGGVQGGELLGVVTLRDAIGRFLVRQEEESEGKSEEKGPAPTTTEVGSDVGMSLREVIRAFRVARVHRIYVTREEGEGGELVGVVMLRDAIGRFLVWQEEEGLSGESGEKEGPFPTSSEVAGGNRGKRGEEKEGEEWEGAEMAGMQAFFVHTAPGLFRFTTGALFAAPVRRTRVQTGFVQPRYSLLT
ncbi:unnamed protein product [Closterium sp. Naga37s-1]|nr:unnamed protein product [Closterium sp. Naga37s-1]